jgi:hypothetical protein
MIRISGPNPSSIKFIQGIMSQTLLNNTSTKDNPSFKSSQNPLIRPTFTVDMLPLLLYNPISNGNSSVHDFQNSNQQYRHEKSNMKVDSKNTQSKLKMQNKPAGVYYNTMFNMKRAKSISSIGTTKETKNKVDVPSIGTTKETKNKHKAEFIKIENSNQPKVARIMPSNLTGINLDALDQITDHVLSKGIQPNNNPAYLEIALKNQPKLKTILTQENNTNIAIHIGLIEIKALNSSSPSPQLETKNKENKQKNTMSLSDYLTKRSMGRY